MTIIQTVRLELVPLSTEFLRASLAGNLVEAERLLGAKLPADWPDHPGTYEHRLAQLEGDPLLLGWLVRGIVLRDTGFLIGHIGFHTGRDPEYLRELSPGGIEFGYTVFEQHRRQGFAYEAAGALMNWARKEHGIRRFVVSISPENLPSRALAAKFGFRKIGSHIDEEDGLEEIYECVWE
ncbi:MAG: GNAT family N-acetyltransferase [Verrucomicrobia bacterium]|nr:GNAT family N-acetyltransferase [Verrucomicrobiota bacterium]